MKKQILLFVSISGLAACAALQQQQIDWRGQDFNNYILSKGTPTSQYVSQNGDFIYSFKKTCKHDPGKEEETIVIVGKNNLIQNISTPAACPSYYESSQYQHRQEESRKKKQDEEQIKNLEAALKVTNMHISLQESHIEAAEGDLRLARQGISWKGHDLSVEEYENKVNQEKAKLEQLKRQKNSYEQELIQLKSMQSR